jgi:hypothetical protein
MAIRAMLIGSVTVILSAVILSAPIPDPLAVGMIALLALGAALAVAML